MLRVNHTLRCLFPTPRLFFTLKGNTSSEAVLRQLSLRLVDPEFMARSGGSCHSQECQVLDDAAAVHDLFANGHAPTQAVALFDDPRLHRRRFSPTTATRPKDGAMPSWTQGAQWGVRIGTLNDSSLRSCAMQVAADFNRHFDDYQNQGYFPWGRPREREAPPTYFEVPSHVPSLVQRLNAGPDFASAIADTERALELPLGSRISWVRVPPEPLLADAKGVEAIMAAFASFEEVAGRLARRDEHVQELLLAGVDLLPALRESYLKPRAAMFSVRRPDLHFTGHGLFSSENDEMPGGFGEVCHVDAAYRVNESRWQRCFDWLLAEGPMLMVVSHEWSKCYVADLCWFTEHVRAMGHDVSFVTTDELSALQVTADQVTYAGHRVGTIWRQFPIFEADGVLADLVLAAQRGAVRMVPEFAHFGNKSWYSLFRSYVDVFARELPPDTFQILREILPHSHLVRSAADFPCTVAGMTIGSLQELLTLTAEQRDQLVLKVSGANLRSARMYGVLMGHGLSTNVWQTWIDHCLHIGQPFIVQQRLETGVMQLPVFNLNRQCGEMFGCRVLVRPWSVGGEVVSISACAVPSNTLRVHGQVSMALCPVVLE